jgi:hypothetical protein
MAPLKQWLKQNGVWFLGNAVEGRDVLGTLYEVRTPVFQAQQLHFYGQVPEYLAHVGMSLGEPVRRLADLDTPSIQSSTKISPNAKLPAVGLDLHSDIHTEMTVDYEIEEVEAVYSESWTPAQIDSFSDLLREKDLSLWQNLRGKAVTHCLWFAKKFTIRFSSGAGVDVGAQVDMANIKVGAGTRVSAGKVGEFQVSDNLSVPFGISYRELRR